MRGRPSALIPMPHRYRVYGLTLESAEPLATPLHPAPDGAPPDLLWRRLEAPLLPLAALAELEPLVESSVRNGAGESAFRLYRLPDGSLLYHYNRVLDLHVTAREVRYALREPGYDYLAEIALLGPIAAQRLGERGAVALHASAVVLPQGAVLFLAESQAGKSTLATSLLRAGGRHLSDDLVALTVGADGIWAEPGYPQIRLWPDSAAALGVEAAAWPRVMAHQSKVRVPVAASRLGAVERSPQPLAAIYAPQRDDEASVLSISTLSPARAFVTLTRHLMHSELLHGSSTPLPLAALSTLVRRVPVRQLRYPSGFQRLAEVHAALLADL